MNTARICLFAILLSLSCSAAEWTVIEYASIEDSEAGKPKKTLKFSPIIVETNRGPEINLKPGRDDEVIDILGAGIGISMGSFRRDMAEIILRMPCQAELKITTQVVPFSNLEKQLGSKPRDNRRIQKLTIESCINPTPAACDIRNDPRREAYEYEDFIRTLKSCRKSLLFEWEPGAQAAYESRNPDKGPGSSPKQKTK